MALAWEIYERTSDPLSLGIVGLARALPTVLLALPAGRIVDLIDRRKVLITTQMGFVISALMLVLGSIAWGNGWLGTGPWGVRTMYLLIALTGCARVFNGPSRASLLPLIIPGGVDGPIFHNAVTWNSGVFQFSAMAGPLIAGAMIWITGVAWPVYLMSAVACLWFAATASLIRFHEDRHSYSHAKPSLRDAIRPSSLLPGMLEGVRHVRRERMVFAAITLDLFAVLLGGATALMPVYAKEILHVGPVGLGALKAAPFVGALLMAVVLAYRQQFQKAGSALLWSVACFGICTIIFGISKSFVLSLVMLGTLGAVDNISVVIRHVLVSVRTPDHLRGRVSAVNSVFIECSNELGGFESGLVAKLFGAVTSVVSGGIGTILVVLGMMFWIPELRRLGRIVTADHEGESSQIHSGNQSPTPRGGAPAPDDVPHSGQRGSGRPVRL
ncbi:MAG: MFS transporter [Planctomycetes bacterium]|nr:MFS transporter [Planctomycetota bacterium]MBI3834665.1 MFS transporter [Planctomycetota bacterium]